MISPPAATIFLYFWAGILDYYLIGLTFYGHKLAVSTTSVFFDHTYVDNWKPNLSIRALTYGFNLTEFQHIKVTECVTG